MSRPTPEAVDGWLRDPASALLEYLRATCAAAPRPLVALFDEVDGLVGAAMVSFLTQLRDLYLARKDAPAPHAVVLAGRRNVRDYTLTAEDRRAVAWLGTSSPFNIAVETVGLTAFTAAEVGELVAQHTTETGQRFTDAAVATLAHLSQGHPWLVNALADQCTRRDVPDRAVTVTQEHVESAKETIILKRRSHIDSLIARLHESRVQRILAPMRVRQWKVAMTWREDDYEQVADVILDVVNTCPAGGGSPVVVADDWSYDIRKRIELAQTQIGGRCLSYRIRTFPWSMPSGQTRTVYVADYFHGGNPSDY